MIYNDKNRAMGILSSKKPPKVNLLFTPQQINPKPILSHQSINITEIKEEEEIKKEKNKETEKIDDESLEKIKRFKKNKEMNLSGKLPQYEIVNVNSNNNRLSIKRMDSMSRSPERKYKNTLALFEENFDFLVERIQNSSNKKEEKLEKIKSRKHHSLILKIKTNELLLSKQLTKVVEALEDEAKALTNTIEISNFYDYTNYCFEQIHKILKENDINKIQHPKKVKIINPLNHSKLAVFDLDETLIHAVTDLKKKNYQNNIITIKTPSGKMAKIAINIRPKWEEVIKKVSKYYTIVIYTASHSSYANAVLDFLDPENKYFYNRLYRNNCICVKLNGRDVYIKDLYIFEGFDLKNILIIDNSVLSFAFNLDNGIPILPYYNSEKDVELSFCGFYLVNIANCDNLMDVNKKYMKLDYYFKKKIEKDNSENKNNVGLKKIKNKRIKRNSYENASELINDKKKDEFEKIKKSKNKKISFGVDNFISISKNEELKRAKTTFINIDDSNEEKEDDKNNVINEKEKIIFGENNNNIVVVELKNNFEKLRNEFNLEHNNVIDKKKKISHNDN